MFRLGGAFANVRFGSEADITRHLTNVCFTPQSGQSADMLACPLSARPDTNSHRQKPHCNRPIPRGTAICRHSVFVVPPD